MPVALCPAELLNLAGGDAVAFANGQFTSDVLSLDVGAWQWSAWLDPQGRVRAFFALLRTEPQGFRLWLPLGGAQAMCSALAAYVFRSAVQLNTATATLCSLAESEAPTACLPSGQRFCEHATGHALQLPGDSWRAALLAPTDAGIAAGSDHALNAWRLADIAAGLPLLAPSLADQFVPQALDLQRFDAIRFDKGCYPGQEIAARLHFRGGNKRHLHRLHASANGISPGDPVFDNLGKSLGVILYAARDADQVSSQALAVLAAESSSARGLLVRGQSARVAN